MTAPDLTALRVRLRREMSDGDIAAAEATAAVIDSIQGPPVEDDRCPEVIPMWGVDA